jgi:hypothetical protein
MNYNQFLDKLNKLEFVKSEDKCLSTNDGWKFTYMLKLMDTKFINLSIQLVAQLRYNDAYVMSWGCESHEDTKAIADWILLTQHKVAEKSYRIDKENGDNGKAIFDSL